MAGSQTNNKNLIPFNVPTLLGDEQENIQKLFDIGHFSGDGIFTGQCSDKLKNLTGSLHVLMTSSCTHALEMAALLCNIKSGDEVIMSPFTHVSSANPFVLRGAKIRFVDINLSTMNLNEELIEPAINSKTRAIVAMHYGAVPCNMEKIMSIAKEHSLLVIEDAAQCIDAYHNSKHLGTIGHFGCISFHDTKNIHCGEGGVLLINDSGYFEQAEIIRSHGTNRAGFARGEVESYSWKSIGSSYIPNELSMAFLSAQLDKVKEVTQQRISVWNRYYELLSNLEKDGSIQRMPQPGNAHTFYIKCKDKEERNALISYLAVKNISATFHYIPLHTTDAGKKYGRFDGVDQVVTRESERLVRLPVFNDLRNEQVEEVCGAISMFFLEKN